MRLNRYAEIYLGLVNSARQVWCIRPSVGLRGLCTPRGELQIDYFYLNFKRPNAPNLTRNLKLHKICTICRNRERSARQWQEVAKIGISCMIPAAVVLFIWMKIRNSIRFHRESVKRRRHERKLKFLQTNRIRETILDQPTNEEIGQDLAKQFPIREGVIYKMKMRKELEKKYLAFRRLRLVGAFLTFEAILKFSPQNYCTRSRRDTFVVNAKIVFL